MFGHDELENHVTTLRDLFETTVTVRRVDVLIISKIVQYKQFAALSEIK